MEILEKKIVLASQSPRRKFLMEQAGFDIVVNALDVEEIYPCSLDAYDVPVFLSELKAGAAKSKINAELIVCADTVVIYNKDVLGKPKTAEEARATLQKIQGTTHDVVTGVSIVYNSQIHSFSNLTKVVLKNMSDQEIDYYVKNYEVMDKAGSYGIQDWIGWTKIDKIEGSYSNVMGLPVAQLYQELQKLI